MTTTIDGFTGHIIDDTPQPLRTIESRDCNTCHCPVCGQVTNEEYMVWLPSSKLLYGAVLCPTWVEGHLACYSRLGDAAMKWRESQRNWSCLC